MIAFAAFMTSCGVTGGGLNNAPVTDDEKGTINGKAYDNETYKCWRIDCWQRTTATGIYADPEDNTYEEDTDYDWGTEYMVRKTWELWKAAANVSASAGAYVTYTSTGDFTMTEVTDRNEDTCYKSYGQ